MLSPKKFENLPTAMAVLVLFEQFFEESLSYFWPLTNDAFCSHSFDYTCLRRLRHIVMKRFEIMGKFYSSKTLLKMAGGGMHTQYTPHPSLVV